MHAAVKEMHSFSFNTCLYIKSTSLLIQQDKSRLKNKNYEWKYTYLTSNVNYGEYFIYYNC